MGYLPTGKALIDPFKALEEAGIREEMKIADLGVGAVGHFLFPAAQMVGPKGTVYAIDLMKTVLEANKGRQKLTGGVDNVEYIWGDIDRIKGTRLPDNSVDMVLAVNVLHLASKGVLMQEAKRIMHSGGIMLAIDWKPTSTTFGPKPESRLTKDEARKIITDAGLEITKEFEAGPSHYAMVAVKPHE